MISRIHRFLVNNPATRRTQLRLVRAVRKTVGVADAFGDLFRLTKQSGASAVLDIGAYRGETVEWLLDGVSTPIHAFEPTPDSYAGLRERFADNPLVRTHNVALSSTSGAARLNCNRSAATNSLLDIDTENQAAFHEQTTRDGEVEVATQTIDDWAAEHLPSGSVVIKSDVQGAEGRLLDGGREFFQNRVAAFYSEAQIAPMYTGQTTFTELHERLTTEFGFVLHNIYPCTVSLHGAAIQTDATWIKPELVAPRLAA